MVQYITAILFSVKAKLQNPQKKGKVAPTSDEYSFLQYIIHTSYT